MGGWFASARSMAELDVIAASLRQQKQDLSDLTAQTDSRRSETAELVEKIEELRQRAEETQRRFEGSVPESRPTQTR